VGGIVSALKRTTTKAGSVMAFLTLEDLTGSVEVIVFPRTYEQNAFLLKKDAIVVVRGRADVAEQQVKILADSLFSLAEAPAAEPVTAADPLAGTDVPPSEDGASAGGAGNGEGPPAETVPELHVRLHADLGQDALDRLHAALAPHRGDDPLVLHLVRNDRETVVRARDMGVRAGDALDALESEFGDGAAWVEESR